MKDAEEAEIYEPNAFVLATVDASGAPTARTVLLKSVDTDEFFFATNYQSRKGKAIGNESAVSMVFGWYQMHRQVVIDGIARRATEQQSDNYFAARPRESQLSAWASQQSQPIRDRALLEQQLLEARENFGTGVIPRPPFWGGYVVEPQRIEFWNGRSNRLHDRLVFERQSRKLPWQITRLQP